MSAKDLDRTTIDEIKAGHLIYLTKTAITTCESQKK